MKVNNVYNCSVVEIFPPYKCTHGPGEDPFEAVLCAVGAASQISCCLLKTFVSYTKHHLNLSRNFIYKTDLFDITTLPTVVAYVFSELFLQMMPIDLIAYTLEKWG